MEPNRWLRPYGTGGELLILWQHSTPPFTTISSHPPLPWQQPPTLRSRSLSWNTATGEGQSVAGAKNKVIVIFIKYMWDLKGNGLAAKHSITRNYNNSTLEDGLFRFITRLSLSCLIG